MLKFILAVWLARAVCGILAPQNFLILFILTGQNILLLLTNETNYELNPKRMLAQSLGLIKEGGYYEN